MDEVDPAGHSSIAVSTHNVRSSDRAQCFPGPSLTSRKLSSCSRHAREVEVLLEARRHSARGVEACRSAAKVRLRPRAAASSSGVMPESPRMMEALVGSAFMMLLAHSASCVSSGAAPSNKCKALRPSASFAVAVRPFSNNVFNRF